MDARGGARYPDGTLHGNVSPDVYFAGDLISFTTGLLISVLLLVLTLRAARLPGTPLANIGFAVCALFWTAGGLAYTALLAIGVSRGDRWLLLAHTVKYAGAAAAPIPILSIWRQFAGDRRRRAALILQLLACISAAAILVLLLIPTANHIVTQLIGYNAALFLLLGAIVALRRGAAPRSVYLPSLLIVAAVCGSLATMNPHVPRNGFVTFVGFHCLLLVVLFAFLLFARFRYADVFIRFGVRILLAGFWASMIAFAAHSLSIMQVARRTSAPAAAHVLLIMVLANALLLSFTFLDDRISTFLNRWLFRSPDYRTWARQLGDKLRNLDSEDSIAAATEAAARQPLELSSASVSSIDTATAPPGLTEGEVVERNFEVWIPIASEGRIGRALVVSPGPARPGLVSHDLNYLRALAAQCGNRLDSLRREREAVELQSREAQLQRQVSEAELRALRAQINPHFLFNSLNTIADLIVRDPVRAEAMTLRLASVFRHVLAHSARPLTTVREEAEFLRTYLHIEEARFGDRLQVEFDISPDVAGESLPSLILQPLVENALKHGLAPKPETGHLWIFASAVGNQVRLRVEDDGLGPVSRGDDSQGLGLANVAERLATLYGDRAGVTLEAREGGGSRVTVNIPRSTR